MRPLAIVFLVGAALTAHGQAVYKVDLESRVEASSAVVEGRVVAQHAEWNPAQTLIHTVSRIEIFRVFKGSLKTDSIEIVTPGGTIGLTAHVVSPSLALRLGDTGVFLIRSRNEKPALQRFEPVADVQGFIRYDDVTGSASDVFDSYRGIESAVVPLMEGLAGRKSTVVRPYTRIESSARSGKGSQAPTVTNVSPSPITAGTESVLTVTGSGFESYDSGANSVVFFPDANRGGSSFPNFNVSTLDDHVLSWTDTEIKVLVPTQAGTGPVGVQSASRQVGTSSSDLTVDFNRVEIQSNGNPYIPDLRDKNRSGGYSLSMSRSTSDGGVNFASSPARAPFERALATWQAGTGLNIRNNGGETASNEVDPGRSPDIVMFDNDASPLESGILGRAFTSFEGCQLDNELIWWMAGVDIVFRRDGTQSVNWNFGPGAPAFQQFDFETVAVHELGHAHSLGHIIAPSKVMHYAITNGSEVRELDPVSDIAGGRHVLENTSDLSRCGQSPMVPLVGVASEDTEIPAGFWVGEPFPNPFSDRTSFEFSIEDEQRVTVTLFDALGRAVDSLLEATLTPASNRRLEVNGLGLSPGVYFVRIEGERFSTGVALIRN